MTTAPTYPGAVADVTRANTEERTYIVSLPVTVTVRNDGTITYEVEGSEVYAAIVDGGPDTIQYATHGGTDHYATPDTVTTDANTAEKGWPSE